MVHECVSCGSTEATEIQTYKRKWYFCHTCGDASPIQKSGYSLRFLPEPLFSKSSENEEAMYDYFVDPVHIAYCIETAKEFTALHLRPNNISLAGKSVLDISGGNGHFIVEIARKEGARPALTEINEPAMAYARNTHGIPVYKFNFQQHRLKDVVADKFDVIMARAAIMFCADLDQFAADANDRLNHGGLMFINHSVIPTLGVAIRVQLDEFSYFVLRQPENVVKIFEKNGFEVVKNAPDPDFFMYVYDHDLNGWWQFAQNLYTIPAVRTLLAAERAGKPSYTFRARDRRRATMIFRKP